MNIHINHTSGKTYTMPVNQAVVYSDNGEPVAVVYERQGMIVYCDAGQDDFSRVCGELGIKKMPHG
jgi:hypothetical protein